jgi:predicted ester cyclase
VHWTATGTFTGTGRFEGMAPNGASIELRGLDLLTVRDGMVVDNQAYTNGAELARQLGALPPAGSTRSGR